MRKELLSHLLENKLNIFRRELIDFLQEKIKVEDLFEYAFLPSMFDAWLMSSQERLDFKLYKLFQPGQLVYDISTYIIVPIRGNAAYVVTLNNIYHRDENAKNEVTKTVREEFSGRRRVGFDKDIYDSVIKRHYSLLQRKIAGSNDLERSAKATWLLAQEKLHAALDNIANSKGVTYVGIVNLKGHIDIVSMSDTEANIRKIYKNLNSQQQPQQLLNEIKNSLHIKSDQLRYKAIENLNLYSDINNQKDLDFNFNQNFKKRLDIILGEFKKNTGMSNIKLANLHGAVIGMLLCTRRNSMLYIYPDHVMDSIYRIINVVHGKKEAKMVQRIKLQVAESIRMQTMGLNTFEKINLVHYKFVFEYYNVLRIEQVSIVASSFSDEVLISKKVPTIPLPEKNKKSFIDLFATGNFDALEHNINLFTASVLDVRKVQSKMHEFFPSFFLSILFEGVLQNKLSFYAHTSNYYDHYSFLIKSNIENRVILLTTGKTNNQISTALNRYATHINSILSEKNIAFIDIVKVSISQDLLMLKTLRKKIQYIHYSSFPDIKLFTHSDFSSQSSFAKLLQNIIYSPDQAWHAAEFNKYIKELILNKREIIFSGEPTQKGYVAGGVMGCIAASWNKLHAIESDRTFGKDDNPYLCVTPIEYSTKRKIKTEINPHSVTFQFRWSKSSTLNLENSMPLTHDSSEKPWQNKIKDLKREAFHYRKSIPITIIASESDVLTHLSPKQIDTISSSGTSSDEINEYLSPRKLCRHSRPKRTLSGSNLSLCRNKDDIKKTLKKTIHMDNFHTYIEDIEKKLHNELIDRGLDPNLIKILEARISNEFDSLGDVFLKNQYDYITGDAEERYLENHKENIKFKLKRWFSVSILYSVLDGVVSYRQVDEIIPRILTVSDVSEGLLIFFGQRFSEYKKTRILGAFLKKIASNHLMSSMSYLGSLAQCGFGVHTLSTGGHTEPVNYYWTLRGLQQSAAIFSGYLKKSHFSFIFLDIVISSLSHITSSRNAVYNFAKFIPLTTMERYQIGAKYFLAMDLSEYQRQIGFKQQLTSLYEYFKANLVKTDFRAIVFYADTLTINHLIYQFSLDVHITQVSLDTTSEITYYLNINTTQPGAVFNLTNFSTEKFLSSHDAYLGLPNDAERCLAHYARLCHIEPSKNIFHQAEHGIRAQLGKIFLNINCKLLNNNKPNGDSCQKYQQVLNDKINRSVKVIDSASPVMPTLGQQEHRFDWISIPLGEPTQQKNECRNLSQSKINLLIVDYVSGGKQCNESFVFKNNNPFILADKEKAINSSVLYLNAPKQIVEGEHVTQLQTIASNPAVIFVEGQRVAYNGSRHFSNYFILNSIAKLSGYVRGGNVADSLQTSNTVNGKLILSFGNELTSPINETLHAIQIEHYTGSHQVIEHIRISYCGLKTIDAKGSQGEGDIIKVDEVLRCNKTDQEFRTIYPGDIHYISSHKPVQFQLNSTEFKRPAFLIQSSIPSIFNQVVFLNVSLFDLTIQSLSIAEQSLYFKGGYAVKTTRGYSLLMSNAYENIVFITQEGVQLFLRPRTLNEIKQLLILHKHYGNQTREHVKPINAENLDNINIAIEYNNTESISQADLNLLAKDKLTPLLFIWQLQHFIIHDNPIAFFKIGSAYNDIFQTSMEFTSYAFIGGEGNDIYKIFPKKVIAPRFIEHVLIDNTAYIYDEYFGQDILDLSAFEYLQPEFTLEKINRSDKFIFSLFGLDDKTIVLSISYGALLISQKNRLRILLRNYLLHEDFRHLFVMINSDAGLDTLYAIDLHNMELKPSPSPYSQQPKPNPQKNRVPILVNDFPVYSLRSNFSAQYSNFIQSPTDSTTERIIRFLDPLPLTFLQERLKYKSSYWVYDIASYDMARLTRKNTSNHELRAVHAGEIYLVDPIKSITLDLNSTLSEKKCFTLVRPQVVIKAPQILHLRNIPFVNLTMTKNSRPEFILPGGGYEIKSYTSNQCLVKTNAYESVVFITQDKIRFFLEPKTTNDRRCFLGQQALCNTLRRQDCKSTEKNPLIDPKIVAHYDASEKNFSLKELIALKRSLVTTHIKSAIKHFAIDSTIYSIEMGSRYDDTFLTTFQSISYRFTGGEGNDVYILLPASEENHEPYRVFINNEAFLYNENYGQDILDLSRFQKFYPNLSIYLKNFDDFEKNKYFYHEHSIVLEIQHKKNPSDPFIQTRIFLENYLLNEDYRHLYIKLSNSPSIFYQIDFSNKRLIPIHYYHILENNFGCNTTFFKVATDIPSVNIKMKYFLETSTRKTSASHRLIHQLSVGTFNPQYINLSHTTRPTHIITDNFLLGTTLLGLATSLGFIVSIFFRIRHNQATTYSPIATEAVIATITASTQLFNAIEAVNPTYLGIFEEKTSFYTKNPSPQGNELERPTLSHHTSRLLNFEELAAHWFSLASIISEHYKIKRAQKFIKKDFYRNLSIHRIQAQQIKNEQIFLMTTFFKFVNNFIKYDLVSHQKVLDCRFKSYLNTFIPPKKHATVIRKIENNLECMGKVNQFFEDLFFRVSYKKIMRTKFSGIPELAENQKVIMLLALPAILKTEEEILRSLCLAGTNNCTALNFQTTNINVSYPYAENQVYKRLCHTGYTFFHSASKLFEKLTFTHRFFFKNQRVRSMR